MTTIIVGLITALIAFILIISSIQQYKDKIRAEKRIKFAKQKAIIDEDDELLISLANLPKNPNIIRILNRRSLTAAKKMQFLMPEIKSLKKRVQDLSSCLDEAEAEALDENQSTAEEKFVLPDDEQNVLAILQCIKRLRRTLKSEQAIGALDTHLYIQEDQDLSAMQLRINIESLVKRGVLALNNQLLGSARQYFEKALKSLADNPIKTDYVLIKEVEITEQLADMTSVLKNTNAEDAAKRDKETEAEDELDMLFQPKKKW